MPQGLQYQLPQQQQNRVSPAQQQYVSNFNAQTQNAPTQNLGGGDSDWYNNAWGQMSRYYGDQITALEGKMNAGLPDFRKFLQMTNQNTLGQQLDSTRRTASRSGQFSNPGYMSSLQKPAYNQYGANTVAANSEVNRQETAYRMQLQEMINRLREQYRAEYNAKMAANQNTTGLNSWLPEVAAIVQTVAPLIPLLL